MLFSIPLAWLQLARQRVRFLVAVAGITFIVVLMFMQLGFRDALYNSATQLHQNLQGDLFLISSQYNSLTSQHSFPRSRLYQALGFAGVDSVSPLYVQFAKFKNPQTGQKYPIMMLGVDPGKPVFSLTEIQQNLDILKIPDQVLFDRKSRPEFGSIAERFYQRDNIIEIYPYNQTSGYSVKINGLFSLGPSFGVDGNLVTNYATIFRLFPERRVEEIDVGLIVLKADADPKTVMANLTANLPDDVKLFDRQSFTKFEKDYWSVRTPIGFVFSLMVFMGFVVGVVIVYQILYTNISSHLIEYATLKAIGFKNNYLLGVVLQQALFLAILGYIPGLAISLSLYGLASRSTYLPINMNFEKLALVLVSAILMCLASGCLSIAKLWSVDPADIF